jgi:hypothetical protein
MKSLNKFDISNLNKQLNLPIDVLICSASFEERCKVIPNQMNPNDFNHVLICENEDLRDMVSTNSDYLVKRFGNKSIKVTLATNDPLKGTDNLQKALKQVYDNKVRTVLIDISTFTHESLLILLKILQQFYCNKLIIQFVYLSASEYAKGMPPEDKWLSKGIGEIRSVLGYPGILLPSRRTHFIVLVGFESERAERLITAYEPAVISLGFAKAEQSISQKHHEVNVVFHTKLSQKYVNVNQFTFSCINPYETSDFILKQVRKFPEHNVVLAAMNTKISTIGAALASFSNETIQLCYAHANQYNFDNYSSPGNDCYLFELPLFSHLK